MQYDRQTVAGNGDYVSPGRSAGKGRSLGGCARGLEGLEVLGRLVQEGTADSGQRSWAR
jgi:hypothetical protein